MEEQKVTVPIPKANENEVFKIPSGKEGVNSDMKNRLDKIDQVVYGVMIAVVLSAIAIIVSVIGLFLDQMRYNNAAYKEYSQKTESLETTQKTNEVLLKQIQDFAQQNKEEMEIIKGILKK